MYLKRIEIIGFKSFATKTVLDFLPSCNLTKVEPSAEGSTFVKNRSCGITSVVGPNGSGKSNIADAIKWAMGEQSLKNLRGKKSEDVIFSGSGKKAQLGSAKVTLVFDNSDKSIPIEFEEVSITRKVYRSGEGEYFINNSKVRLVDVADLLAKAGVGQRSYCIINQGMADSVLNATPVERRVILEEAAGVKPYQLKKDRSLRKLDTTRNNLVRVGELVNEIEPHLRVLKRQSEKAKKGESVTKDLKEKQNILYGFLWNNLEREKRRVSEEKEEVGREEMKLQRSIDDLEIRIKKESAGNTEFEKNRQEIENKREEIFSKLDQSRREMAMIEAKIEIEKERAKNFEIIHEIPVDFPYFKDEFRKLRGEFERLEKEISEIVDLAGLQKIKEEFHRLRKDADRIFSEISEGKKIEDSEAPKRENTVDLKAIGELEEKRKKAKENVAILESEIARGREKMNELIKVDREARETYFKLEAELREKHFEISKIREKLNAARVEMAKYEVREEDLSKRILQELGLQDPALIENPAGTDAAIDPDALEREINRLKIQTEQIGSIDPMIVEECEETQKRYDFLTGQSKDLEKAIVSLAEIIKEMDEKIKESFEETFKRINHEFSKYFKIIFGGGSAELLKIKIESRRKIEDFSVDKAENAEEADDVDETEESMGEIEEERPKEVGIEIKACPPGKRITNLGMLSGGERSLTSQALLFAIIANSPPPFAVLDEVEAALDEANSKRFGRILTELSNETQFILISHNRETMRQASVLYGVTMGADGVSKVLSVKLDQIGEKGQIK